MFGVKLPMRLSMGAFDDAVRETIESDAALNHALLPMLQARGVLFDTFLELDRRVKRKAREDGLCRRFMGVPGVGEITALSFKAAVDDPSRFKSSRTVGAHFGLTPRRFQSGEKDNQAASPTPATGTCAPPSTQPSTPCLCARSPDRA